MSKLTIVIPTTRGPSAFTTIRSALGQEGFERVEVIVTGNSCVDPAFREQCERLSPRVHAVKPSIDAPRLPGGARNDGLDAAYDLFPDSTHFLFLDDDIQLPPHYGRVLKTFLDERETVVAVLGRVVSVPSNYWGRVIDYSNFWWAQVESDIPDLGWLATTATLVRADDVKGMRFNEAMQVGEDVDFFRRVAERAGNRTLAICSGVTCRHDHGRCTVRGLINYQVSNGLRGVMWHHPTGVNLRVGLRNIWGNFSAAWRANRRFLKRRPLVALGVAVSFGLFEYGIQLGSYRLARSRASKS